MRKKNLLASLTLIIAILSILAGCQGGSKNEEGTKKCYATYGTCLKACNDAFSKALDDDMACRNKCNADYLNALEKCGLETDPAKRRQCEKDALDAVTKCLNDCTEKFKQAFQTYEDCMAKCKSDLDDCLSKLK